MENIPNVPRLICAQAPEGALERFWRPLYADNLSIFLDAWRRTKRRKHAFNAHEKQKQVIREMCSFPVACFLILNSNFPRRVRGEKKTKKKKITQRADLALPEQCNRNTLIKLLWHTPCVLWRAINQGAHQLPCNKQEGRPRLSFVSVGKETMVSKNGRPLSNQADCTQWVLLSSNSWLMYNLGHMAL